jgi:hypothetical protein
MTITTAPVQSGPGSFIEPMPELSDIKEVAAHLNLKVYSGFRAPLEHFAGQNRVFDSIAERIANTPIRCEDQCSAQHYADLFEVVRGHFGRINRVVEVGVFMGGASTLLAGCLVPMDLTLDLVDISREYLLFTYERIHRTFPEAADRVRLFHGDLPTYVHQVLGNDADCSALVHHDGAHDFQQVVKDLSSLYYVRDRVRGLMIQDTHLRGRIEYCNFVDAAVYAVFGFDMKCQPLGQRYGEGHAALEPNRYQGNYFLPNTAEGAFIPFAANTFKYPHPSMKLEEFLPKAA